MRQADIWRSLSPRHTVTALLEEAFDEGGRFDAITFFRRRCSQSVGYTGMVFVMGRLLDCNLPLASTR